MTHIMYTNVCASRAAYHKTRHALNIMCIMPASRTLYTARPCARRAAHILRVGVVPAGYMQRAQRIYSAGNILRSDHK